jgi:hypothetical protein
MCLAAVLIIFYQFYAYSASLEGTERQNSCQTLGTAYITLGIVSLVFRTMPVVIAGLVLIMMGLRLIAHGLDRIDKNTFIDRYDPKD